MNDSDPRPMPPQVLAAYRDPLNLTDLLESEVFTDRERFDVRDELLERLTKKYGNVEVEIGKSGKLVPIRQRIAKFKKNAWGSIEVMIAAQELGGREAVMRELATVMQPHWLRWWDAMDWINYYSMHSSIKIAASVLCRRQIVWLAAQYARSVVESSLERQVCVEAISAAEAWAIVPSVENFKRAKQASDAAYAAAQRAQDYASRAAAQRAQDYAARAAAADAAYAAAAAYSAAYAAYAVAYPYNAADAYAADAASYAADAASYAAAGPAEHSRLCELTKRLITPTLITHASRGL